MNTTLNRNYWKYFWISLVFMLALFVSHTEPAAAQASLNDTQPVIAPRNNADYSGDSTRTLTLERLERRYLLHLPATYDPAQSYPLVVVLHGMWGTSEGIAAETGFSQKADQAGFIVAYPQGLGTPYIWNTGINADTENLFDDVHFIRMMIEDIRDNFGVDPSRIFITGHSNGAIMTYRLGSELSDLVAAIAPVEGSIGIYAFDEKKIYVANPTNPVAVAAVHGRLDGMAAYDENGPQTVFLPVLDGVEFWAQNNWCSRSPAQSSAQEGGYNILHFSGCRQNAEVTLYMVDQADHFWPTLENSGVSATDLVWDFFAAHPRVTNRAEFSPQKALVEEIL